MASTPADLGAWLAALTRPGVLIELAALAACLVAAGLLVRLARGALDPQQRPSSVWFGTRIVDGVLFPVTVLLLALAARWWLAA